MTSSITINNIGGCPPPPPLLPQVQLLWLLLPVHTCFFASASASSFSRRASSACHYSHRHHMKTTIDHTTTSAAPAALPYLLLRLSVRLLFLATGLSRLPSPTVTLTPSSTLTFPPSPPAATIPACVPRRPAPSPASLTTTKQPSTRAFSKQISYRSSPISSDMYI